MILTKTISKCVGILAFSMVSLGTQAASISINGVIENATGTIGIFAGPGTEFSGGFDFGPGLNSGQVILAGFCFNSDIVGLPPVSESCPTDKSPVPILAQGETSYSGELPAPGTVYEQEGSTFDGVDGTLNLLAYSPSFNVNIAIDVLFSDDGTGTMSANAGILGTADGSFTWDTAAEVPVPAAAWLFGSALVGLSSVGRRRRTMV